jgi:putative acetyltransferase
MLIRSELPSDRTAVHAVNSAAFETPAEANLVEALRESVRPIVSLVAEDAGEIVGHIMFSPVELPGHCEKKIMGLAPMAVVPARQRCGIGSALVRRGLEECKELGVGAVVVLGHREYYPRFGFVPSTHFGFDCEYDVPADVFMAIELQPGSLRGASGTIKYHPAFQNV